LYNYSPDCLAYVTHLLISKWKAWTILKLVLSHLFVKFTLPKLFCDFIRNLWKVRIDRLCCSLSSLLNCRIAFFFSYQQISKQTLALSFLSFLVGFMCVGMGLVVTNSRQTRKPFFRWTDLYTIPGGQPAYHFEENPQL